MLALAGRQRTQAQPGGGSKGGTKDSASAKWLRKIASYKWPRIRRTWACRPGFPAGLPSWLRLAGYRRRPGADIAPKGKKQVVNLTRRFRNKPWVQKTAGILAAEYLRLVWKTSRFTMEPADPYQLYENEQPLILAIWHGQHFMMPFFRRDYPVKVLISRHSDGEINAIAAERLGVGAVRGSGDHGRRFQVKGGVTAFRSMVDLLAEGCNVALTADVPKVSRVAGLGIIKLASESGRPIFPVALATSRRIVLNNWDRSEVNLPFSRGAIVVGEAIRVPGAANAATLEQARGALERALNAGTERAHAIVDRRETNVAAGPRLRNELEREA
jgi:lysophospholipid acyltransferase (LPLAT)-like uncharacterized protein